ncbi:hypothetical protein ACFO6V_17460 [Promicromonospora alba]|uniref:Uncharacterized protein n=1 Tax=Promicromonospora alba TaxID=1616110 RepID=A0ABV9HJP6_9MICO
MNQLHNTTWGIAGRRLVIVLAAAVLATAGCAATDSGVGGEQQAGSVAEPTADAGERPPEGEPGESEERAPADSGGGTFCVKLEESGDAFSMESLDGDPGEIDELVNSMRELAAVAPGEIKAPMDTAVDFYEKVADVYVTKDEDAIAEIQGEAEAMVLAAEEVGDWVATNCPDLDVDLATGGGSGE